ncbi:MAG TPA: phage tail sheath subtilisin-like domain-containing protein [Casimicrobiaceae bacterium]|nr:phage tail sheath subtilisin-like domain-containing protein [Casimicrobiaceae bacterium]
MRIVGADGGFIAPTDGAFVQALNAAFVEGGPVAAIDTFNLICVPGLTDVVATAMLQAYAVGHRAFLIADCEESATVASAPASLAGKNGANAANSALYFPWVIAPDPLNGSPRAFPPCGFVAGIYARTDDARGVWKAPAGESIVDATGLTATVSNADQELLNPLGINCLRNLPVRGLVVWGARTLAGADAQASEWKYVNVRRFMMFVEQSIDAGTKWAVFEPNGEPLWAKLRASVGNFLDGLWRSGALIGNTPTQSFFVRCDGTTTTQADIDNGMLNIVIGVAPVQPAEFVIIRIAQFAAAS